MKKISSPSAQLPWDCPPEPDELTQPIDQGAAEYSGFVIVRLSRQVPFGGEAARDLRELAKRLQLQGLLRLFEEWPDVSTRPLIRSLDPEKLIELERQASKGAFRPLRSLTAYWRLDTRGLFQDEIEKFLKTLNSLPEVDIAYLEQSAIDPMPPIGATNPYLVNQGYLEAAPQGVGARWAWTQTHGRGAGVGFVDVERAWLPSHEDLDGKSPTLMVNANQNGIGDGDGNHGTAVLAVAVGIDNTVGVIGLAHETASVGLASHYDAELGIPGQVADAILGAIASMAPGDVLLLEVIRGSALVNWPTETDPADFDAIRLAVALGVIVIEAAGNSNRNLDQWSNSLGQRLLNRADPNFLESGAIVIGAAFPTVTDGRHDRLPFSNHGSRVDCYSWGIEIVTAGYGDLANTGNSRTYTGSFRGTSGAAAIIAGVALVLQGLYEPTVGTRLSPTQMRSLLANPATGTLQGSRYPGNIGVMPNLQAIAQSLALVPDVYLRDSLGDSGLVPSSGPIGTSPDILLHTALVKNPTQYFETAEGEIQRGSIVGTAAQDYYLYARMRNRGGVPAFGVTARIYRSEFATLTEPATWTLIGTSAPVNVPVGNVPIVTDAIVWKSANQPKGPYTLIAILDHPQDPAPPLPTRADWDAVLQVVRRQNNVAQRNISFVEVNLDTAVPTVLGFILVGASDRDRCFDLNILQQLPEQVLVWWDIPLSLLAILPQDQFVKVEIDPKQQRAKLLLPRLRCFLLCAIKLPRGVQYKTQFLVQSSEPLRRSDHTLTIRQLYQGQEVGRLIWMLRLAQNRHNGLKLPC